MDTRPQHGICPDDCCCVPPTEEDFYDNPEKLPDGSQRQTIFFYTKPKPDIIIPEGMVEKVVPACGCHRYKRVIAVPKTDAGAASQTE